jgi:hypothetical protein
MDATTLRYSVQSAVNELDPEGLLAMGAPADEYDAEVEDFIEEITSAKSVSQESVRKIWKRWFDAERDQPPVLDELAERLTEIQKTWRERH